MPYLDDYASKLADAYDYHVLTDIATRCATNPLPSCMKLNTTTLTYVDNTDGGKKYKVMGVTLKNKINENPATYDDVNPIELGVLRDSLSTVLANNTDLNGKIADINNNMMPSVRATYNVQQYDEMKQTRDELDNKMRELYNEEETDHQLFFDSSTYLNLGLTVAATSAVYFLVTNL